jgi:superfamily II DNA or RNA helicase
MLMKANITNENIIITNSTAAFELHINNILSFVDKSKQYQLKRMEKNPWQKASPQYKILKSQVTGTLVKKINGDIVIPSGFAYLLNDMDIVDNRHDTGKSISLPWKHKPFDLRPYQVEAVETMKNNYRGLMCLATGMGKTLLTIYAIREIGKKTLIVCPRKSIANQFYKQLCSAFGSDRVGYLGNGKKSFKDITVGIVGTIKNSLNELAKQELGLICFDEVHHLAANTFYEIVDRLGGTGKIFGLTATDFRSDGKDVMITAGVGPVVIKRDVVWGVENKYLATPYVFVREAVSGKREYPGDKLKNYKSHVLNSTNIKSLIENDCKSFMDKGMSVLCLVSEVAHGEELGNNLGIPFATGCDKESSGYVDDLNNGKIRGLIGTDSFIGEGTDTQNVDVLIMANFVASKGPVIQCLGRGLRKTATKDKCIIIDYKIKDSNMLARHCDARIKIYKEITKNIKVLK